jgi:hypothetical protein
VPGGRREQRAIRGTKLRPCHLAPQDLELVAQDQQLEVLDVQPTARSDHRAQQENARYRNEKATPAIVTAHAQNGHDTSIGALQARRSSEGSERNGMMCSQRSRQAVAMIG